MKKKQLKWILPFVAIAALLAALVSPIDQLHYTEEGFYAEQRRHLEGFRLSADSSGRGLRAGWARAGITPGWTAPMAGYRLRPAYEGIHDSLQAQALVLKKGDNKAALLSLDLLIFPPALKQALADTLPSLGWDISQLYLSATHTHSSIGGWIPSLGGRFIAGPFEQRMIDWLLGQSLLALQRAEARTRPVKAGEWRTEAPAYVHNRLSREGSVDPTLQGLLLKDSLGKAFVLGSYAAHPTCLDSRDTHLSAGYPGYYREALVQEAGIEQAMFLAGPMGSHAPTHPNDSLRGLSKAKALGRGLALATKQALPADSALSGSPYLAIGQLPLELDTLQARISDTWGSSHWAFEQLLGTSPLRISCLRLGKLLLLSTPCDYSGELALELYGKTSDTQLLISGFNGGYVGYITPDRHYFSVNKPETREMNWTGPYTGSYMQEVLGELASKAGR